MTITPASAAGSAVWAEAAGRARTMGRAKNRKNGARRCALGRGAQGGWEISCELSVASLHCAAGALTVPSPAGFGGAGIPPVGAPAALFRATLCDRCRMVQLVWRLGVILENGRKQGEK